MLALLLPFFAFFISILFGRYLGTRGAMLITTGSVGFSLLLSCWMLWDIAATGHVHYYSFFSWMDVGSFSLTWSFLFDQLSVIMFFVVTFVSFLVHLYSTEYMHGDPHQTRFMAYLSLFTFFMLVLVSAGNLVQTFLGWEGVGIASYLLINFWFTRTQANKSALKAIVVNRVGDFFLGMAIFLVFYLFKTLEFPVVFSLVHGYHDFYFSILDFSVNLIDLVALFLFLGAVGKSAQLGLHTWLPDAMEGPTPVSALIHAATMVTAGVFVLIRMSPILEYSPSVLQLIALVGSLTALFGATVAVFQNDIKKIIAYSTCSQLGYMVFSCGLSNYDVAFFHLFNHAFFKALLFLSAGSVIHALADEQDLRKMGGLVNVLPVTYLMFFIGSFSLAGFPFLTGFYSKDLILELSLSSFSYISLFSYTLGVISAFFTAFYSIRLLYLAFFITPNVSKAIMAHAHEPGWSMMLPLLALCAGSIWFGYAFKDLFVGMGTDFWSTSIFVSFDRIAIVESEFMPASLKLIPVVFSILGTVLSYLFVVFYPAFSYSAYSIEQFLNKKWFFDHVYNAYVASGTFSFGKYAFFLIDRGVIELFGPEGFLRFIRNLWSILSSQIQTGYIFHYLHLMVSGLLGLLFFFLFPEFSSHISPFFILVVLYYWSISI
jgi:proton-translocating NADH-quinone oxidoreductase chain L